MEIREMRMFVAVVEEGSLTAAARRLHVSQPALSPSVASLEREMGIDLVVRTPRGVTPTAAGTTLVDEARAVLARYEQALSAVRSHTEGDAAVLRVGLPLELPSNLLSEPLARLSVAFPTVRLHARHASSSEQLADLRTGALDLGLVREHPVGPDLDALLLLEEPLGVLLAAELAQELTALSPAGVRLNALAGLDWIGFAREGSPAWYDEIVASMRSHGITPAIAAPAGDQLIPEVKFAAVVAGGAFAFAPPQWAQPIPDAVSWVPLAGSPLIRRTWAVWPAASRRRDLAVLVRELDAASTPHE